MVFDNGDRCGGNDIWWMFEFSHCGLINCDKVLPTIERILECKVYLYLKANLGVRYPLPFEFVESKQSLPTPANLAVTMRLRMCTLVVGSHPFVDFGSRL